MHNISRKAEEYLDSAVELLSKLISYPSIMGTAEENAPYGRECARVLDFAYDTLKNDGFVVKNFGHHAVTASFDERPAELGILCHLDVVPVDGQEWTSDPFKADIRNGRVFGRGAIDDKGPAAAVITAMRIIRDSGVKLSRNVRLILGSNEENGSSDMEYYVKQEKFPPMLFTPDGSFPVINIEKGMIRYRFCGEYSCGERAVVSFKGGSVVNAVPERASAVICGVSADEVNKFIDGNAFDGILFSVENTDDNTICINARGKGAHASTPEQGVNAITALAQLISKMGFDNGLGKVIAGISEMFPFGESDGGHMGVKCSDEKSGALTLVLSVAECNDGHYEFMCDCRFPICKRSGDILSVIDERREAYGMGGGAVLTSEPHYADENSEMVRTLLAVFEDCTGKKGECVAIGGGTYVHDTENGVAFGAEWSDENNMHGADEFIGLDELKKDIEIYTEAILRLCV